MFPMVAAMDHIFQTSSRAQNMSIIIKGTASILPPRLNGAGPYIFLLRARDSTPTDIGYDEGYYEEEHDSEPRSMV